MAAQPSRAAIVAAFAAIYVIWGSTYLGILFAIQTIPPLLMAGTRYFTAGVIMYAAARVQGAPRSGGMDWRTAGIVGACLIFGGNGGVTVAEQYIPSGLAAVIVATVPIYVALLSWLMNVGRRPTAVVWLGLAGGFTGVGILLAPSLRGIDAEHPHALTGISILLCSSFLWSLGSVYSRKAQNAPSPFLAAGQQMLCGGALLMLVGAAVGEHHHLDVQAVSSLSIWAWLYLVFIGAIVGFTAYIWLLRHVEPAKVATYAYVNPIVAVLLGTLFAGETFSLRTLVAAAVIIGSVALVITADQLRARSRPAASPLPKNED
jgi:drug/metabolite transporter (DMT)-like permease